MFESKSDIYAIFAPLAFVGLVVAGLIGVVVAMTFRPPRHKCFAEALMSKIGDGRVYTIARHHNGVWDVHSTDQRIDP